MSNGIGFVLVIAAVICNGSFLVPFKNKAISVLKINDNVFAFYFSIGTFISSIIVMALTPLNSKCVSGAENVVSFVPLGLLSGLILMASIGFNFIGTNIIGISLNTGICSGFAICTSIVWGLAVFDEPVTNYPLLFFGIIFLVVGILCIANINKAALFLTSICKSTKDRKSLHSSLIIGGGPREQSMDMELSPSQEETATSVKELTAAELCRGLPWAIMCGITGGTFLVPLHYVPASQGGFVFMPSFGIGVMIGGTGLLAMSYFGNNKVLPTLHWSIAAPYGILSGVIWNMNNVLVIIAIPILGFALAFPLVQLAILVAGTWGIFFFNELHGQAILVFYSCAIIVFLGAVMLAFGLS